MSDDCTQEAMLRCMHVLSITGCRTNSYWETDLNAKTKQNQWTLNYSLRANIDDGIQEAMLRCMQVPSITTVGPTVTEKLTYTEKLKKVIGPWNIGHKWPRSKPDLEIIKTNILNKIHDDCFKNVTSRVLIRFSFDLAQWPSFWPQVTQFWSLSRNHQDKHFEQYSWWMLQKCDLWSVNKVFLWFGLVT